MRDAVYADAPSSVRAVPSPAVILHRPPRLEDLKPIAVEPYAWQVNAVRKLGMRDELALFAEPRCGKSLPFLEIAQWRYLQGRDSKFFVDLVVVFAMPGAVPYNWERVEVAKHVRPDVNALTFVWNTQKAQKHIRKGKVYYGSAEWMERLEAFRRHKGLRFLFVNADAATTEGLLTFLRTLFPESRVFVALDESSLSSKGAGERQKKLYNIGHQRTVVARAILDGTPIGEGPVDLFYQVGFLSKGILGFDTYTAFRARYCVLEKQGDYEWRKIVEGARAEAFEKGLRGPALADYVNRAAAGAGKSWIGVKRDEEGNPIYQNLGELWDRLDPLSVRVRRRDISRAPSPVFQKSYFELTKEQRRVYNELRDNYEVELHTMERVEARHVLTRMMRLQQVTSNYFPQPKTLVPCPTCGGDDDSSHGQSVDGCPRCKGAGFLEDKTPKPPMRIDLFSNPRLDALRQLMRPGLQTVIWTRFHPEIDEIVESLRQLGFAPQQYDGRMSDEEKDHAKVAFQQKRVNPIVGTPRSGGRGVALPAELMIYYTNEFSLLNRLQSQDRCEMPGNKVATDIVDILGADTNDERIVDALRFKRRISDTIMKERSGKWL